MTMVREVGCKEFPIWLLGDSNPKNWEPDLDTPLDPRHPARHSIWTPILNEFQDRVYRQARLRVDTSNLYIRNAIVNPSNKPLGNQVDWSEPVLSEISELQSLIKQYHPVFLFCFGAFSYEFARRASKENPNHAHSYWGAERLGEDFTKRVASFECDKTNIFPLLHVSIARGKFMKAHEYYCNKKGANYFEYVGSQIANILLAHKDDLQIWIQ